MADPRRKISISGGDKEEGPRAIFLEKVKNNLGSLRGFFSSKFRRLISLYVL